MENSKLKMAINEIVDLEAARWKELEDLKAKLPTKAEIEILARAVTVHSAGATDYNGKELLRKIRSYPTKD